LGAEDSSLLRRVTPAYDPSDVNHYLGIDLAFSTFKPVRVARLRNVSRLGESK